MIKNAMSLKAHIRNLARSLHVRPQAMLQLYLMERLLERLSLSQYRENFILKGGLLITSMVGAATRTSMDMDATVKNFPLRMHSIQGLLTEVCAIDVGDNIQFEFKSIGKIRESDEDYIGYRVTLTTFFPPMAVDLKLDITTGDVITPGAIEYDYPLMFEERSIPILSYNLETILAEKLEAILSRAEGNTRARDYYDLYMLTTLKAKEINWQNLHQALLNTTRHRKTQDVLSDYRKNMDRVIQSEKMYQLWDRYRDDSGRAADISLDACCQRVLDVMDKLNTLPV